MGEWKKTWCNLCAVTCGLEMQVEDNRIVNVRPDPSSPRSVAFLGGGTYSITTPAATALPLMKAIGTQYNFNPVGVEFMGDWWSHGRIFGYQFRFLEPDDENNEAIVYWGSNAYVSHQMPNAKRTIRSFSRSADKMVIVVDPRLSETARMADLHIMPALGTGTT